MAASLDVQMTIEYPEVPTPGQKFTIKATITNTGDVDVDSIGIWLWTDPAEYAVRIFGDNPRYIGLLHPGEEDWVLWMMTMPVEAFILHGYCAGFDPEGNVVAVGLEPPQDPEEPEEPEVPDEPGEPVVPEGTIYLDQGPFVLEYSGRFSLGGTTTVKGDRHFPWPPSLSLPPQWKSVEEETRSQARPIPYTIVVGVTPSLDLDNIPIISSEEVAGRWEIVWRKEWDTVESFLRFWGINTDLIPSEGIDLRIKNVYPVMDFAHSPIVYDIKKDYLVRICATPLGPCWWQSYHTEYSHSYSYVTVLADCVVQPPEVRYPDPEIIQAYVSKNTVAPGEQFTITLTVHNRSDAEGAFYLGYSCVPGVPWSEETRELIGAGATKTYELLFTAESLAGRVFEESQYISARFAVGFVEPELPRPDTETFTWTTPGIAVIVTEPPPPKADLYGIVADKEWLPIAGAIVEIDGHTTESVANGAYSFMNIDPGSYTITCAKEGYWDYAVSISLVKGDNTKNITLTPTSEPQPPPEGEFPWLALGIGTVVAGYMLTRRK